MEVLPAVPRWPEGQGLGSILHAAAQHQPRSISPAGAQRSAGLQPAAVFAARSSPPRLLPNTSRGVFCWDIVEVVGVWKPRAAGCGCGPSALQSCLVYRIYHPFPYRAPAPGFGVSPSLLPAAPLRLHAAKTPSGANWPWPQAQRGAAAPRKQLRRLSASREPLRTLCHVYISTRVITSSNKETPCLQ